MLAGRNKLLSPPPVRCRSPPALTGPCLRAAERNASAAASWQWHRRPCVGGLPSPERDFRSASPAFESSSGLQSTPQSRKMARKQGHRRELEPRQAVALFAAFSAWVVAVRIYGAQPPAPDHGLQPLLRQPGCPSTSAALLASVVDQTDPGEARRPGLNHWRPWSPASRRRRAAPPWCSSPLMCRHHAFLPEPLHPRLRPCRPTQTSGHAGMPPALAAVHTTCRHGSLGG